MVIHDLKHIEFNRATENGELVREAEIHAWCICGRWFLVVEHRHFRTVSDAFIQHLAVL